jgi:hypothetical protein
LILRACILCLLFTTTCANTLQAQLLAKLNPAPDTNYIADLSDMFAFRIYGSNKFTGYKLGHNGYNERLVYRPNSNMNIGFGGTYKFLTINIGFPAPFINNDKDKYGKTKFLDLQSYLYMRKLTIDLYAQFYNGYYLANRDALSTYPAIDTYLHRPDIKTKTVGTTVEYIFNNKKFSYRAAYLQNEWQKKSAGSFMAGGGFHYVNMRADSSVIPSTIVYSDFFNGDHFNRAGFVNLTANAGYAHTFVIAKHFFIMGEVLAGVGGNYTQLTDTRFDTPRTGFGLNLSGTFRVAAGYNSERYFVGLHAVDYVTHNMGTPSNTWQQYEAGNIRFSIVKRFVVKKPLPRPLNKVFNSDLPAITN